MNYIFLTPNFDESGETKYFAIPADKIETLNVFETYDKYGQKVGHENAGDYHIDNSQSDAKSDCEIAIKEKYGVEVSIDAHNSCIEVIDNTEVDEWISENEDENAGNFISELNAFILEWCNEKENISSCQGFTYWNGNDWKTIITDYEFDGNPSHSIVDDEDLIVELSAAIENKEFVNEGFGCKNYESGNWNIEKSYYQGTWASYILTEKE